MKIVNFENIISDSTSKFYKIKKIDYKDSGLFAIVDQGQNFIGGYTDNESLITSENLPVIVFGDHTKTFKYIDFPFTIGADGVKVLEVDRNKTYPKYIYYFLKTIKLPDAGYSRHFKFLKDVKLPIPETLSDQLQIANILSKAETLIEQRKQSIALLDELLKSSFLEMFGDPVRNVKRWEKLPLKEYARIRIGPFGSLLHREDYVQNGIPLVNPSHISEGKIVIDGELTISKEKMRELSAYVMHEGDVVLGRRGEIGRCAVVTKNEIGFLCGTGSIFIRPTNKLQPIYLYNVISSSSMRKVLENSAKGITMKNLNSGIVEELKIPVPPTELQTQFTQLVEKTEALKEQYKNSLQELENLYGSLTQQAFKGKLVFKNTEQKVKMCEMEEERI